MISGPVAVRPVISGRRASSSQRALGVSQILVRRLRRATLCALSLYLSFIIMPAAGEKAKEAAQPVNLFVDITSSRLADEVDMSKKRRLDVAGMPVVVGAARQNGDAAPSVAAGIAGSYKFDLGHNVSMKPSGMISRVHTDGAGILSSGRIGGDVAIQYQQGGSGLLLRPSLYASMQEDVLDSMDYALEGKLWRTIGWGLDLTATLGHSWRESELLYTSNREAGYGRLGFEMDLLDKSGLELSYGFNTTDGPLASQFRVNQGPMMAAHLNLAEGWRLDGSYSLNATERGYDDNKENARRHDLHHRFNFKSDWEITSTTGAEWHVSAAYDFDQTVTDAPVCVPASHAATLNFALNF
jgi:hypothetical protein